MLKCKRFYFGCNRIDSQSYAMYKDENNYYLFVIVPYFSKDEIDVEYNEFDQIVKIKCEKQDHKLNFMPKTYKLDFLPETYELKINLSEYGRFGEIINAALENGILGITFERVFDEGYKRIEI